MNASDQAKLLVRGCVVRLREGESVVQASSGRERAMLRLVRPELEQRPGDHEAGHGDEDTAGGHRDITEGEDGAG